MRWFLAFFTTALLTLVVAAAYIVAYYEPAVPGISALLRSALPTLLPWVPAGWAIPAVIFAFFALVRAALIRTFAYKESEIESSPRGRSVSKRDSSRSSGADVSEAFSGLVFRWLYNPTRGWLAPYVLLVNLIVWLGRPLAVLDPMHAVAWALSALYGATLALAMVFPDRPLRFRAATDVELDSVLVLPSEPAEP
jgi:hypothetical protein